MVKRHVGRPTNEEVNQRRRKKFLKIIIPVGIVLIIGFFVSIKYGNQGLKTDSVCGCDGGWNQSAPKKCTREFTHKETISALLVGDVDTTNSPGEIDYHDLEKMTKDINNNVEIDESQKKVYDYEPDGVINANDYKKMASELSSGSTSGIFSIKKYICPDTETSTTTNNEMKTTVTKQYTLNNDICIVKVITTDEKDAKCISNVNNNSNNNFKNDNSNNNNSTNDNSNVNTSDIIIKTKPCDGSGCVSPDKKDDKNMFEETFDEEGQGTDDNDDDFSVINKQSSYLKYADNNLQYVLNVSSQDSRPGVDKNGKSTNVYINPSVITYSLFSSLDDCENNNNGKEFTSKSNNYSAFTIENYAKELKVVVNPLYTKIIFDTEEYGLNLYGRNVYIKQTNLPKVIKENSECKLVTIGKTKSVNFKNEFLESNRFSDTNYDIYMNNENVKGKKNLGPIYAMGFDNAKLVNKIPEKKYKFIGWSVNADLSSYYDIYCNGKDNSMAEIKYGNKHYYSQEKSRECSSPVIIKPSTSGLYLNNLKYSGGLELKTEIRVDHEFDFILDKARYNSPRKKHGGYEDNYYDITPFVRDAKIRIYNSFNTCYKDSEKLYNKNKKFQRAVKKTSTTDGQYGWVKKFKIQNGQAIITANLSTAKDYFVLVNYNHIYYDSPYNNCLKLNTNVQTVNIHVPKQYSYFTITYSPNMNEIYGDIDDLWMTASSMKEQVKEMDVSTTLRKNKLKNDGYKFSHWIAFRANGTKKECRGFASESNKNAKKYSWTSIGNCNKYGYKNYKDKDTVFFNAPKLGVVHMVAQWKKK